MIRLGVNIDHIATLRQARFTPYPNLTNAVKIAESAGADGITMHLREDRRHIQDSDVQELRNVIETKMNLEMAATEEMLQIALEVKPQDCCIVPERRAELTTEGGLDVIKCKSQLVEMTQALQAANVNVSLFIEANQHHIDVAAETGANKIELHTGSYANYDNEPEKQIEEFNRIRNAAMYANQIGLIVNAGHGLNYENVQNVAQIKCVEELNIGHAIIAHSIFVGLSSAVEEMIHLIHTA